MSRMKSTSRGKSAVVFCLFPRQFSFPGIFFPFTSLKSRKKINLQIDESSRIDDADGVGGYMWISLRGWSGGQKDLHTTNLRRTKIDFCHSESFSSDSAAIWCTSRAVLHRRIIKTSRHRQQQRNILQLLMSLASNSEASRWRHSPKESSRATFTARSCPSKTITQRFGHKFSWVGGFQSFPTHRPFTSNSHLPSRSPAHESEASETIVDVSGYFRRWLLLDFWPKIGGRTSAKASKRKCSAMAFEGEISRNLFSGKRERAKYEENNFVINIQGHCPDTAEFALN